MNRFSPISKGSLASGFAGGLLVAVLAAIAIATGLIDTGSSSTQTTTVASAGQPTLTRNASAAPNQESVGAVYKQDGPAVAYIESQEPAKAASPFGPGDSSGGTATGSGFLIDNQGHVLTNAHVVDGASSVTVKIGDGATLPAKVVGTDDSTDVAVLQVDASKIDATPLQLGDSGNVTVGDSVVAIGNPFGLDRTVTSGIISALQRQIDAPNGFTISNVLQTDAAINPGNSGGPLINSESQVVGINSQIATDNGGGSTGIGFAIPIDTAKSVAGQLIDNGQVKHAYLGISGTDLSTQIAQALNLSVDSGALVEAVTPGGPAQKAGIVGGNAQLSVGGQPVGVGGDVITAIDGHKITGMDDLISVINTKQPGDTVSVTVIHKGQSNDVSVQLGDRPAKASQG